MNVPTSNATPATKAVDAELAKRQQAAAKAPPPPARAAAKPAAAPAAQKPAQPAAKPAAPQTQAKPATQPQPAAAAGEPMPKPDSEKGLLDDIPFGSPEQQAAEKAAAAAAAAKQTQSLLPGARLVGLPPVPPFSELTLVLFSKPGTGKTVLAASNKEAYFLGLEPGQNFIQSAVVHLNNWADFQAHVVAVHNAKKQGNFAYKTAVIDIVDVLAGYCRDFVCKKAGVAYPPETDFGKTWRAVTEEWTKWMRGMMRSTSLIFITHCNEQKREFTNEKGITIELDVSIPTFAGGTGGGMGKYLDGIVNAMGHLRVKTNGRRAITFAKDARTEAKDRTDILSRLGEIELPLDPKAGWAHIDKLYTAKAKELGYSIKSMWAPGAAEF